MRREQLTRVGQIEQKEAHSTATILRAAQPKNDRNVRRDDQNEEDAQEDDELNEQRIALLTMQFGIRTLKYRQRSFSVGLLIV